MLLLRDQVTISPTNLSPVVSICSVVCLLLSILSVAGRVFTKAAVVRRLAMDDFAIVSATVRSRFTLAWTLLNSTLRLSVSDRLQRSFQPQHMDWENTGPGSINRIDVISKRSISFSLILVQENQITYQSIVDLCFQPSLYIDHNPSQDFNRLIPSNTSTHRRVE